MGLLSAPLEFFSISKNRHQIQVAGGQARPQRPAFPKPDRPRGDDLNGQFKMVRPAYSTILDQPVLRFIGGKDSPRGSDLFQKLVESRRQSASEGIWGSA